MLLQTTACLLLLAVTVTNSLPQSSFASTADAKSLEKNLTTVSFTTNTTKVENKTPFLATCTIANFADHASRNYTVRYFRSNRLDSRQCVASYKLTVKHSGHQSLIFDSVTPDYYFSASPGPHFAYPTFDLVVKNSVYVSEFESSLLKNYWCEVDVEDTSVGATFENVTTTVSNVWVNTPIVQLAISGPLASDPANTTFTASCHVNFLEKRILKGPEYQVKLLLSNHANLISNQYKELAVFKVPTVENTPMVFLRNDSYLGRTAVSAGDNDDLPLYDFVYRAWGTGGKKDYFACRLENPASEWKQVTSDKVLHL